MGQVLYSLRGLGIGNDSEKGWRLVVRAAGAGMSEWGWARGACLISPLNTAQLDILDQCDGCRRHESKS